MNEKIQKLRKLAERYALDSPSPMNAAEFDEIFDEIFADLIVRECIGIVENLSPGYKDYRDQIENAFRRDCVEKMKEQFGVE